MLYLHVTDNLANTNINSLYFTHVVTSSLSQKHTFLTKNANEILTESLAYLSVLCSLSIF